MNFRLPALILLISCIALSCKKKGCTDPFAYNYNESAEKEDNSCYYGTHPININSGVGFEYTVNGDTTIKSSMLPNLGFSFGYGSRHSNPQNYFQSSCSFDNSVNQLDYLYIIRSSKQMIIADDEADFTLSDFSSGTYEILDGSNHDFTTGKYSIGLTYKNKQYSSTVSNPNTYFKILNSKPDIHYNQPGFKILCEFNCDFVSLDSVNDTIHVSNGRALFFLWKKRKEE